MYIKTKLDPGPAFKLPNLPFFDPVVIPERPPGSTYDIEIRQRMVIWDSSLLLGETESAKADELAESLDWAAWKPGERHIFAAAGGRQLSLTCRGIAGWFSVELAGGPTFDEANPDLMVEKVPGYSSLAGAADIPPGLVAEVADIIERKRVRLPDSPVATSTSREVARDELERSSTAFLLAVILPRELQDELIGDFLEHYRESIRPNWSRPKAGMWFYRHAFGLALRAPLLRWPMSALVCERVLAWLRAFIDHRHE
jgi:hypothetical protein